MDDLNKTMEWLREVSDQALQDSRRGDTHLANQLGDNAATSYYFNNVHLLQSMTAEQWAAERPNDVQEAERLRLRYEALDSAGDNVKRLNDVESELASLRGQLKEALDALKAQSAPAKPTAPVVEPKKPAAPVKKGSGKDTGEDDAESEA